MVYFLRAGVILNKENAKFWPILALFGYFVQNYALFGVLLTGLNNVAVYQNWQISGTYAPSHQTYILTFELSEPNIAHLDVKLYNTFDINMQWKNTVF